MYSTSGPNPSLYGFSFPVNDMSRNVLPWKAVLYDRIHFFFVYDRAIFTAFSIASEPLLRKMLFVILPGAIFAISSASLMYDSYGETMKQMCMNLSSWSWHAFTMAAGRWPQLCTPIPTVKSR